MCRRITARIEGNYRICFLFTVRQTPSRCHRYNLTRPGTAGNNIAAKEISVSVIAPILFALESQACRKGGN